MECGGLSVTDMTSGTPWMPLWCAGSCATSMRVRTLNAQTLYLLTASDLFLLLSSLFPCAFLPYCSFQYCTASTNKLGERTLGKRLLQS